MKFKCQNCGDVFVDEKHNNRKFCNRVCVMPDKNNPNWNETLQDSRWNKKAFELSYK